MDVTARNAGPALVGALALALVFAGAACKSAAPPADAGLTLFAAASTTDVMTRIAAQFETQTGVAVRLSFASSSTLAKQIESGARADVYVSANPQWMDYLAERGLVQTATRRDIASNALVLIAPRGRELSVRFEEGFAAAEAFGPRLALGDPEHVPAGMYAKAALETLGWWDALAPRVVPAVDVRAALGFVELGEADAGIVYATDAAISARVELVGTLPRQLAPPIRYPAALTRDAHPDAAKLLDFLTGPEARAMLDAAGFRAPPD